MGSKKALFSALMLLIALCVCIPATAQNLVSGDITGIVTDPTGAVLPNVQVTLKNHQNGQTQTSTTNAQGVYRFSLLAPGGYTISATPQGFQATQRDANVTVGQTVTVSLQSAVSSTSQTVEVTAQGGVVQTQTGDIATNYTPEQIAITPNPGNDLSYIVQTAPGAVMNTQGGYGNDSTFGLPGTSNLFTVNGMNENDPFLNLNNSGATNLLLGQNDVQEATVVNNGYSGQYGQLAGANVNYVTKSGTNAFHGNASYFWNGRVMNANNWFNNNSGTPRPFVNANQWGASFGGPIIKNKTFFFVDTEGLRVVLPTSAPVNIPSPQFQAATLANLATVSPGSIPFYNQIFSLYNNAPGANRATIGTLTPGTDASGAATGIGCGSFSSPLLPAGTPCALQFRSTAGNFNREWLLTGRVDQNLGNNDRAFIHFRTDHGVQASYTDPLTSVFNASSNQPQYEGQLNETHTFGSSSVNQFILSGSWYSAVFQPANLSAATALAPFQISFNGGAFYRIGRDLNIWPQGRNVTQYQIVDDFSKLIGNHSLKFGVNFRRYDVTNYDPGAGAIGSSSGLDLGSFFNGTGVNFTQSFPTRLTEPIALYGLGLYAQDEWAVRSNLRLTLSLRADHNSNPVCQTNCFARFNDSFLDINHNPNLPYNQSIQSGLHQALTNFDNINWQPRFGFAWTPLGADKKTVIRGGIGLFIDQFPAFVVDGFITNTPLDNTFTVGSGALSPAVAGSQAALAAAANTAFVNGFAANGTATSIAASLPPGVPFVPPSIYNAARRIHSPQYQEWNLSVEQGIGQNMSFQLNYVGNHGIHEAIQNAGQNGYCDFTCLGTLGAPATATNYLGLPTAPIDPRFGTITQVESNGVSNYNGLTVSVTRKFAALQLQANYTWSHALDVISNAGFLQYNFNTNISVLNPTDPFNVKRFDYGNADYDTRHYFSLNYVYNTPKLTGWKGALASWTLSGTLFSRSGLPYTITDSSTTGVLNSFNYGTIGNTAPNVFANYPAATPLNCGRSAINTPCPDPALFTAATTGFGLQRRNQFYGPGFFDTDLTVMKNFNIPHWESGKFGIGVQMFNVLNHPNFDQPNQDIASPQFGLITNTVNTPTSILGGFVGADAAPRQIQIKAALTF
jgi:outer membrane receptor protein involved in Fe transport